MMSEFGGNGIAAECASRHNVGLKAHSCGTIEPHFDAL